MALPDEEANPAPPPEQPDDRADETTPDEGPRRMAAPRDENAPHMAEPPAEAPAAPEELDDEPARSFEQVLRPRNRRELMAEDRHSQRAEANFHGITADNVFITTGDIGEHLYRRNEPAEANWEVGLDQEALKRVAVVFDRPPPYARAYDCLHHNRLVIVHGPGGSGKSAAAYYLAHEIQVQERVTIRKLSADTDLRRWSRNARAGGDSVYLIEGLLGTRSREMPDHLWRELADALKATHAFLVISASHYVTFAAEAQAYVQPWEPPADGASILRKHLRYFHVGEEQIAAWLSDDEVGRLLAERPAPQVIYSLALCLKQLDDGGFASLSEALHNLALSDEAAVAEWFELAADDEERARWLALAVFNGSRFRLAQQAAETLARLIRAAFGPAPAAAKEPATPWFQPLDDWRKRAGVDLRLEDYDGQSVLPVEVIRLSNPSLPQGIMRYLWGRMPHFRSVLLDWLAQLGAADTGETRIRAATAVAALAQLEYETVLRAVLERWVRENTPQTRQSLSHALRSLARTEQYAEATFLLLRHWSTKGEVARVWAAARAYGLIGPTYPREAMDGWLGILARYNYLQHYRLSPTLRLSIIDPTLRPLFDSLFEAIASFFVAALAQPRAEFVRIYSQIITALRVWLEENDDGGLFTLTSLVLFLGLMNLHIGGESLVEGDAGSNEAPSFQPQGAPALLVLVHFLDPQSPALADLAWLLGLAVRTQATRKDAIHGAVHDWLVYLQANRDEQLYTALRRVLQLLVRQPSFTHRWRREVGRPLEQWAARKPPRPTPPSSKSPPPAAPPLPMAGRLVREVTELQG